MVKMTRALAVTKSLLPGIISASADDVRTEDVVTSLHKASVPWEVDFTDDAQSRLVSALRDLAAHNEALLTAKHRLAEAMEPIDRISRAKVPAQLALQAAEATLASLDAAERHALEQWADTGEGEKPTADIDRRRELEQQRDTASRDLRDLTAAAQPYQQRVDAIEGECHEIDRRGDALVAQALVEEAELIGHRYVATIEAIALVTEELLGINDALLNFRHVRLQRQDVPLNAGILPAGPQIFPSTTNLADLAVRVRGFALRANNFQDIIAYPTEEGIAKAAKRWLELSSSLMTRIGDDDGDIRDRARLIAETADLRERLTAADQPKEKENVS